MNKKGLRLFKIDLPDGEIQYFHDRRLAQNARQLLIQDHFYTVVMRGPDHKKGESFNDG